MHERRVYYNIVEANAMIPRLEHLFAELGRIQRRVNDFTRRASELGVEVDAESLERDGERSGHPVRRQIEERLRELARDYADALAEIEELGVIVDDLDGGVVNFYSWIEGREVFLSWQTGEPEIGHWHAVTENVIARRALKHLVKSHRPVDIAFH